MTQVKLKIKKGDSVLVIAGNSKGKSGKVLNVNRESNRVLVEGVNFVTKHVKPTAQNTEGKINKMEAPIHISNVSLLVNKKPTKVGRKLEGDKLVRYAKSTGEILS